MVGRPAKDSRFLVPVPVEESAAAPITVVVNWQATFKEMIGTSIGPYRITAKPALAAWARSGGRMLPRLKSHGSAGELAKIARRPVRRHLCRLAQKISLPSLQLLASSTTNVAPPASLSWR